MLADLKQSVYEANMEVWRRGLVVYTWGNVSGIDPDTGLVVIKPSGISYETMKADDMVVCDLEGNVLDGKYKPSSDLQTHLILYRTFPEIRGVVHTHSTSAVAWAQAQRDIPSYGTTHADYFYGAIPCTRQMSRSEIENHYELETGHVIIETLNNRNVKPMEVPGVVVCSHGPFTWGKDASDAVHNAVVLEEVAKMALLTETLNAGIKPIAKELQDKHYFRKHGNNAYYGQR